MQIRLKKIKDQVIVITGASSGIGLATARLAAKKRAKVILSSRNEEALRRACAQIQSEGGLATYVTADVSRPEDVQNIANTALREFGGFDTWVNNAAVAIYGSISETDVDSMRRLFDVNFWGMVHGSKIAIPYLRKRGGALINIGSVVSDRAFPLLGTYSAAKHAIKGFTDTLRMELSKENAPISVTLIKPGSIDTPFIEHARNFMEEHPAYAPPVYSPEVVARAIITCAQHPHREVYAGGSALAVSVLGRIAPRITDRIMERYFFSLQKQRQPRNPKDNLFSILPEGSESNTHFGKVAKWSVYTTASLHPKATGVVAASTVGLIGVAFRSFRKKNVA